MDNYKLRYRGALSMVGIGIASTAGQSDSTVPTITSGAGAPTAAEPNGSKYLRTNGTDATDSEYQRIAGAWVALDGS